MNTPEKEAHLLIDMYRTIIRKADVYAQLHVDDEINLAKDCAFICCNKVLGDTGADRGYAYWESVKQAVLKYNNEGTK